MVGLSVVIPCYNEEACLPELHRRVAAAAHQCFGDDHEIVLINDGSRDRTWAIMQELAATDPNLICLNLARNHGHPLALSLRSLHFLCATAQNPLIDCPARPLRLATRWCSACMATSDHVAQAQFG